MSIGYYQLGEITKNWIDLLNSFSLEFFDEIGRNSWLKYESFGLIACSSQGKYKISNELKANLVPIEPIAGELYIVGFKVGSFRSKTHYHSSKGGVLPDYRRKGIALQLQNLTESFVREKGIVKYTYNTYPNIYQNMFLLGLRHGFTLVNHLPSDQGFKVTFQKNYDGKEPEIIAQGSKASPDPDDIWVMTDKKEYIAELIQIHKLVGWKIKNNVHFLFFRPNP